MSEFAYYASWLAAGLLLVAVASAVLTRHLRRREQRLLQAPRLAQALGRYSLWVASQRRNPGFELDRAAADAALAEARQIQREAFPELAADLDAVLAIDARLDAFLAAQRALRRRDTEAWLESDHEQHFTRLWQEHEDALLLITLELQQLTGQREQARMHRPV